MANPIPFPAATPAGTLAEACALLPGYQPTLIERVHDLFAGQYPGYEACDTKFHDLIHTCDATTGVIRILRAHPPVPRDCELAITAALLHDAGYIKEAGDTQGTGAKHTRTHVERSAQFAAKFLPAFQFTGDEIRIVQQAIRCTGLYVDTSQLAFQNDRERFLGHALGTGDMLGQLASVEYPARLPALYEEFREGGVPGYASVSDLMRQTRGFFEGHVREMLDKQWGGVARYVPEYFPAIEANLAEIDRQLKRL